MLVPLAAFGAADLLLPLMLSSAEQRPQIFDYLPGWPWEWYAIAILLVAIVLITEKAVRMIYNNQQTIFRIRQENAQKFFVAYNAHGAYRKPMWELLRKGYHKHSHSTGAVQDLLHNVEWPSGLSTFVRSGNAVAWILDWSSQLSGDDKILWDFCIKMYARRHDDDASFENQLLVAEEAKQFDTARRKIANFWWEKARQIVDGKINIHDVRRQLKIDFPLVKAVVYLGFALQLCTRDPTPGDQSLYELYDLAHEEGIW